MTKYDNMSDMTLKERTERYTARRIAQLRGSNLPLLMDERAETYITHRLAELRGEAREHTALVDEPYIGRRLAELRQENK